jgi:hypothetical protein
MEQLLEEKDRQLKIVEGLLKDLQKWFDTLQDELKRATGEENHELP